MISRACASHSRSRVTLLPLLAPAIVIVGVIVIFLAVRGDGVDACANDRASGVNRSADDCAGNSDRCADYGAHTRTQGQQGQHEKQSKHDGSRLRRSGLAGKMGARK